MWTLRDFQIERSERLWCDQDFPKLKTRPHMSTTEHAVGFFTHDDDLVATTAQFMRRTFAAEGRCIAVLTRPHQLAVNARLAKEGCDPQGLIDSYRLVHLDAHQALDEVCRDGVLDTHRYLKRFGDLIRLCAAGGKPVGVVGEVVTLLAAQGRTREMRQVEELCNELSRIHDFRMLCLYLLDADSKPFIEEHRYWLTVAHGGGVASA